METQGLHDDSRTVRTMCRIILHIHLQRGWGLWEIGDKCAASTEAICMLPSPHRCSVSSWCIWGPSQSYFGGSVSLYLWLPNEVLSTV